MTKFTEPTNADRAAWAKAALIPFTAETYSGDHPDTMHPQDLDSAIGDLICDLMHFAQQRGMDAQAIHAHALSLFGDELADGGKSLMRAPEDPSLLAFAQSIARMRQDGETDAHGKEFVMENDDAVATLNDLIDSSRRIVAEAEKAPLHPKPLLQELESGLKAGQEVIDCWEQGDLAAAVRGLSRWMEGANETVATTQKQGGWLDYMASRKPPYSGTGKA